MLFSSFTTMMWSGRLRSVFAHEKSADVALRTCSNCHTSRLVVRSLAFETTVKCALLTSIHWSAALTLAADQFRAGPGRKSTSLRLNLQHADGSA